MRIRHLLSLIILILSIGEYSYARESDYRNLGTKDGFSNLTCYSIFKDSKGFIWFGMNNGLNRFDGVNVKVYPEFEDSQIFSISEKDNYLWIGSSNRLKRMNLVTEKIDEILSTDEKSSIKGVRDLYISDDNILYIASETGLYMYRDGKLEHHIFESNVLSSANFIFSIVEEKKDSYWLITRKGLIHFNPTNKSSELYTLNNAAQLAKQASLVFTDNTLYIGLFPEGIIAFDCKSKQMDVLKDFKGIDVSKLIYEKPLIYAATGKGLKTISTLTNREVSIDDVLDIPNNVRINNISSLLKVQNGYWVNVFQGGIYYIETLKRKFEVYSQPSLQYSTKGNTIRSFWVGKNEILVGTKEYGLDYISEDRAFVKKFTSKSTPELPGNLILFIKPYNNKYLIGTYTGLTVFDPKTLTFSSFSDEKVFQENTAFYYCEEDKNNNLWFATNKGLINYNTKNRTLNKYLGMSTGVIAGDINLIYCDSKNRLWIGTTSGVHLLDIPSGILKSDIFPKVEPLKEEIKYFFEDSRHFIWICTQKDGVIRLNQELTELKTFSTQNILPNNVVSSIIEDKNNNLWFATLSGILKFNANTERYRLFGYSDGITNSFFYNRVQYDSKDNTIWWANGDGLLTANLDHIDDKSFSIPQIVSITISGKKMSLINDENGNRITPEYMQSLSLESGENTIRIAFSLLNFSFSKGSYEYMLEGYDKDWQKSIENDEIEYSNLAAGSYLLKIREFGKPESERSVKIRVSETFFSYIVIFLAIIFIVFIAFIIYWKKIRVAKTENVAVVSETPQEVVLENKPKYKFSKTDKERLEKIYNELIEYIKANKPYTNPDLKLSDLASEINYPPYELSKMFSLYLNKNYYDFINEFRINLFKELADSGEYKNYTLMSIAEQCGFKSKSSFYGAFKKIMNTTPNEYIKR